MSLGFLMVISNFSMYKKNLIFATRGNIPKSHAFHIQPLFIPFIPQAQYWKIILDPPSYIPFPIRIKEKIQSISSHFSSLFLFEL